MCFYVSSKSYNLCAIKLSILTKYLHVSTELEEIKIYIKKKICKFSNYLGFYHNIIINKDKILIKLWRKSNIGTRMIWNVNLYVINW